MSRMPIPCSIRSVPPRTRIQANVLPVHGEVVLSWPRCLVLNGLMGLMLGWAALPAVFTALLLQAVFFGHGGYTTLGVRGNF